MFAKRTDWKLTANQLTLRRKALEDKGVPILDLSESNPTRCQFKYLSTELLKPLTAAQNLSYDPDPRGLLETRKTIADYYRAKQIFVDPNQIFLTASTSEAYSFLFRLLLNPGERILVPRPGYPLFNFLTDLNDIEMDLYSLRYEGKWHIDFQELRQACRPETKAVILVNPNNPTGSYLKRQELAALVQLAKKKNLILICDEVFSNYSFLEDPERAVSTVNTKEVLTFTLEGISKTFGLPQMKLAWIVASGPEVLVEQATERLEMISDTYLSVSTPIQRALPTWIALQEKIQKEIIARLRENQTFLSETLTRFPSSQVLKAEGGWYAVIRIPRIRSEEEWALEFLERDHVFVHPGYFFDFEEEAYLILSLLPPPRTFQEGVLRILSRIEKEGAAAK